MYEHGFGRRKSILAYRIEIGPTMTEFEKKRKQPCDDDVPDTYELKEMRFDTYFCIYPGCAQSFTSKEQRRFHHINIHKEQNRTDFNCDISGCFSAFLTPLGLEEHNQEKHKNCEVFKCFCGAELLNKASFSTHQQLHVSEAVYGCEVDDCDSVFTRREHLMRHIKRNHTPLELRCNFPGCDKVSQTFFESEKHIIEHEPGRKKFTCDVEGCADTFVTKGLYVKHRKYLHNLYECAVESCSLVFKTGEEFRTHGKTHTFKCNFEGCTKETRTASLLGAHKRVAHPKEKAFECSMENCKKSYTTKYGLAKHFKSEHSESMSNWNDSLRNNLQEHSWTRILRANLEKKAKEEEEEAAKTKQELGEALTCLARDRVINIQNMRETVVNLIKDELKSNDFDFYTNDLFDGKGLWLYAKLKD